MIPNIDLFRSTVFIWGLRSFYCYLIIVIHSTLKIKLNYIDSLNSVNIHINKTNSLTQSHIEMYLLSIQERSTVFCLKVYQVIVMLSKIKIDMPLKSDYLC